MNKIIIATTAIILIILGIGGFFLFSKKPAEAPQKQENTAPKTEDIQGMKVEILKEGSGVQAKPGDDVIVHYVGTFENGQKFDSSIDRGEPFVFPLGAGRVIKGWDLGVVGMKVGEKRKLTIPPELGYGFSNTPGSIPPGATLIFEVEMLKIGK